MDRVRFGVVGAGGIARRRTLPGMRASRHCEVRAVMDVKAVQEVADEVGVSNAYTRIEDLLAMPEVEAVYIATPAFLHHEQVLAAAEAGKHVLCEKPLALDFAQAREMAEACRTNGVFLQEGYMMKFHGAHQAIRRLIDDGALGRVVSMRAQLSCWFPPMEGAWRQDPERGGGGALIDMATHLFDLLEYFAGPVRRVAALTGNLVHGYATEDAATTLLEFESGAHATVDTFFCVPDAASRTRLEVYGSAGSVLTEGTIGQGGGGRAEAILGLGKDAYDDTQSKDVEPQFEPLEFPELNPYSEECDAFARCIRAGTEPQLNGTENALRMIRLTELAYASSRDGEVKEFS